MNIQRLFQDIPVLAAQLTLPLEITALTEDSRAVAPGALFVAVPGVYVDGHSFLQDAVAHGAVAAIGEAAIDSFPIPYFQVSNSRRIFSELAAAWHGHPARKLILTGVTGTDGKTTTVNLLYHILKASGIQTGMISTVNAVLGSRTMDTGLHVTTPDPMALQAMLAEMVESGLTHAVLEVTSHGLAQHRVLPEDFQIAVLTNVTHEHLDYHGSFQAYCDAKAMLFQAEPAQGGTKICILNRGDPSCALLEEKAVGRIVTYGAKNADYTARQARFDSRGLHAVLDTPRGSFTIESTLLGEYNLSNIMAAFSAAVEGLGIRPELAAHGIADLAGIPGRMELIDLGQPFLALVDFAHTPNALRVTLETCRTLTAGSVIAVFGSAGLRDREKRRMMAWESARHANTTIFTAEDPRTEDVDAILAEMADGAEAGSGVERESFWRIPDRGEAIAFALSLASPGDLVVVCGKGHEQSMCFGDLEYPWDDRTALRAALSRLLDVAGPAMPYLPTQENRTPDV